MGIQDTEGFKRLWPTLGAVGAMAVSLTLLGPALRSQPRGPPMRSGPGWAPVCAALIGSRLSGEAVHEARLPYVGLVSVGSPGLTLGPPD